MQLPIAIVKILAAFTETPNAPDFEGKTPMHEAIEKGHTEIVKILAPFLSEKPNVPDAEGQTFLYLAAIHGHSEISKILRDVQ